jgi:hypothetical protein
MMTPIRMRSRTNRPGRPPFTKPRKQSHGPALDDSMAGNLNAFEDLCDGDSDLQRSRANGQRGWNVHPEGGFNGFGTSPATGVREPPLSQSYQESLTTTYAYTDV